MALGRKASFRVADFYAGSAGDLNGFQRAASYEIGHRTRRGQKDL